MATSEPNATNTACDPGARSALRQGSILPSEVCRNLKLIDDSELSILIVATHDCDCVLPVNAEPFIEAMKATVIASADGNFTNAKNPRKLHLELEKNKETIAVEVIAAPKIAIPKQAVEGLLPDNTYALSERNKQILSSKLRSRYSRMALPDELVERLRPVKISIEDVGKASPYALHGIYIYYDPQDELGPEDIYEVEIFVLYDVEFENAKEAAEAAVDKIRRRFELKFRTEEVPGMGVRWKGVFLSKCEAVSDINFTFADTLSFQRYHLDHISLRQDPQGSVPEAA